MKLRRAKKKTFQSDDMETKHTSDGNVTRSSLMFTPRIEDAGRLLICKADNPDIPGSEIQDSWKLQIYYVPQATIYLGRKLDPDDIEEGDDVYFECHIKANPQAYKVSWRHNGEPLRHNVKTGIILSNQSLVLQSVKKNQTGRYTCLATNLVGVGESKAVRLDVKLVVCDVGVGHHIMLLAGFEIETHIAPICRAQQITRYGVGRREEVQVRCQVEARPAVSEFRWGFNSSTDVVDIAQSLFTVSAFESVVSYTPMTARDYGNLLCWAANSVGKQKTPCVFEIQPAGIPDPPRNCNTSNITTTSLEVHCTPGFDGGIKQQFHLNIFEGNSQIFHSNLTSETPDFLVDGLLPGSHVLLSLSAQNAKGQSSEGVVLQATTLRLPERIMDAGVKPNMGPWRITPILGVLIGVVAALVMAALIIVVVMRFREGAVHKPTKPKTADASAATRPLRGPELEVDAYGVEEKYTVEHLAESGLWTAPSRNLMTTTIISAAITKAATTPIKTPKIGVILQGPMFGLTPASMILSGSLKRDFDVCSEKGAPTKLNNIIPYTHRDPCGPPDDMPFTSLPRGSYHTLPIKQNGDLMYAELDLPRLQSSTRSILRPRGDSTVYATIDHHTRDPIGTYMGARSPHEDLANGDLMYAELDLPRLQSSTRSILRPRGDSTVYATIDHHTRDPIGTYMGARSPHEDLAVLNISSTASTASNRESSV
ncbi:unnamed protein product [Cyprideis torosa]|uniref:Uncharacterized protein n=1 Tax=Cyprideis torosa TaxID=163714 RepID=A0A7R8W1M5_9CRUS|nr:unnamed protein product [Cyprideis torosa]CAG0881081.1 unnamed protein product [Cyprideis torosa]